MRDKAGDGVSVASTEPPPVVISPHNENSCRPNPPAIVIFHCLRAASSGGELPINEVRKIPARLPSSLVDEVTKRGICYKRPASRKNTELEIGWEQQFATHEKSCVEAYLAAQGISHRWALMTYCDFGSPVPCFGTIADNQFGSTSFPRAMRSGTRVIRF